MNQSTVRILASILAVILLIAACAPSAPDATQESGLAQQVIEQSVALTIAAQEAKAKDQQLIEQAVALTVAAQNLQMAKQQVIIPTLTPAEVFQPVETLPDVTNSPIPPTEGTPQLNESNSTSSATLHPNAPVILRISPPEGPTRGGTFVTITGKNFIIGKDLTRFDFGENEATDTICAATTKCTVKTPPGKEGIVVVSARILFDENTQLESQHIAENDFDGFKYNGPPKYGCDVLTTAPKNLAIFRSGENFAVKWIVKNSGENAWPAGIDVKFSAGVNMSNQSSVEIPVVMNPNDTYAIKISAVAPGNPSTYYMTWIVEGMGCAAYVAIVVE
jgi:hypothetical protein